MWTVYAITATDGQSYVGISNNPDRRLREHNSGKCHSTRGRTWSTYWRLEYQTKEAAHLVERWLKTGDTRQKKKLVHLYFEAQDLAAITRQCLRAAEIWQADVVRKNTRGCPPRSI